MLIKAVGHAQVREVALVQNAIQITLYCIGHETFASVIQVLIMRRLTIATHVVKGNTMTMRLKNANRALKIVISAMMIEHASLACPISPCQAPKEHVLARAL